MLTLNADHPPRMNRMHQADLKLPPLGVDERTLKAAVAAVGNSAAKVREYLKTK